MMSRVKKLTCSGMVAALCTAILFLCAVVPRFTLAVTALAGIFPAAVVILCGYGWAAGCAVTVSVLSLLLLPNKSAALWFAFFFGHYPIWKAAIEGLQTRIRKPLVGWVLKLVGAGICLTLLFFLFQSGFLGAIPGAVLNRYGLIVVCVLLAVSFVVYDIAFSILIGYFRIHILPRFQ